MNAKYMLAIMAEIDRLLDELELEVKAMEGNDNG